MDILAIVLLLLSQSFNAIEDAINFTSLIKVPKYNHWWHIFKWILDRPFLFISGVLFSDTIINYLDLLKENWYYYLWHYPGDLIIFIVTIFVGFLLFQVFYRLSVNFIHSKGAL